MGVRLPFSTVFVAGAYGVGKTTFSVGLAESLGATQISASTLIRSAREKREKSVRDVGANQDELLAAIIQLECASGLLVLDGHFCVLGEDGGMLDVPVSTFQALSPSGVILLNGDPGEMAKRMVERDGADYSEAFLELLQRREGERAVEIAEVVAAPLLVLKDPGRSGLEHAAAFVRSLWRS